MTNEQLKFELAKVADKRGKVTARFVVEEAEPKSSPLHPYFEWDDSKAGHAYRLEQARDLIQRVTVTLLNAQGKEVTVGQYTSLTIDRIKEGGGYYPTISILSNKAQRQQLLKDAFAEMERFQQKYAALKELSTVFAAMRRVKHRATKGHKFIGAVRIAKAR